MIGLDTNILVRYLIQDDAVQSPKATEVIERRLTATAPGFISIVAMAETAWVLSRSYGVSGPKLADAIKKLLEVNSLIIEHERDVYSALRIVKDGRGTFADGVIAALGHSAGCAYTHTFDEKVSRIPQFKVL